MENQLKTNRYFSDYLLPSVDWFHPPPLETPARGKAPSRMSKKNKMTPNSDINGLGIFHSEFLALSNDHLTGYSPGEK